MTDYQHFPAIFDRPDLTQAREIILTPEAGLSTDERWALETAFLKPHLDALPNGLIIDFGCGVGRLTEVLAKWPDRTILAIDASVDMLFHVGEQIGFESVVVGTPPVLDACAFQASAAIAVWSLQHCFNPDLEVRRIWDNMQPEGVLLVVGRDTRYLPVVRDGKFGWLDDGKSVKSPIERCGFVLTYEEPMPTDLCNDGAWLRKYRRRG